jgi:hypothetical protein
MHNKILYLHIYVDITLIVIFTTSHNVIFGNLQ